MRESSPLTRSIASCNLRLGWQLLILENQNAEMWQLTFGEGEIFEIYVLV